MTTTRRALALLGLAAAFAACDDVATRLTDGLGDGDAVAPTVLSTDPAGGAEAASLTGPIRITFSEPVDPANDTLSPLVLTGGGRELEGELARLGPAELAVTPVYALDPGVAYEAVLPWWAVSDTAGNPMEEDVRWSFRAAGAVLPELQAARLMEHVAVLAHDSMRGRKVGSAEELAAARYIADRFRDAGLEPGAPDYLQSFQVYSHTPDFMSQNVVGVLPGRGALADEWLVVGAHYDHQGVVGGEIYNGADDNASGTAVLVEVARTLGEHAAAGGLGRDDRRSVMFHGYGAEEVGLIGSTHFCQNPTVPMGDVVGMMNMDMVGRLRGGRLDVKGPLPSGSLGRLFTHENRTGLSLVFDLTLLNRSDQRCFYQRGKTVAFLHTGLHALYHDPGDDVETLNEAGLARVADLALGTLAKWMLEPDPVAGW